MKRKVNFLLNEDIQTMLSAMIPAGERSQLVNEAIKEKLASMRRFRAAERMEKLHKGAPSVSATEIVKMLRTDRKRK